MRAASGPPTPHSLTPWGPGGRWVRTGHVVAAAAATAVRRPRRGETFPPTSTGQRIAVCPSSYVAAPSPPPENLQGPAPASGRTKLKKLRGGSTMPVGGRRDGLTACLPLRCVGVASAYGTVWWASLAGGGGGPCSFRRAPDGVCIRGRFFSKYGRAGGTSVFLQSATPTLCLGSRAGLVLGQRGTTRCTRHEGRGTQSSPNAKEFKPALPELQFLLLLCPLGQSPPTVALPGWSGWMFPQLGRGGPRGRVT